MDDITTGQVNRKLSGINLLCMAFVICNSWAGIAGSLQLALIAGGPATLVYSILVTTTAYLSIAASMAELAAVYPTAGGQYHFTSILAPEKFRRGLSYTCALLAVFSWLAIGVSVTSIAAQQLLAVISAGMLNFAPQPWHVFLVYQGFSLLAILYNALALKRSPWTHNLAFVLTILLFFSCFLVLLLRGNPKEPHDFVWNTFLNQTGWPDGICFLIGLSTSCYMYNGLDAAMHMTEECGDAKRMVPRVMMGAIGIGFITGFAYTVAQVYAISDIEEIMTTSRWIPFVVMEQGFRSHTIAIIITCFATAMALTIIIATQEASSRLVWAFARDNGLLFSHHLQKIQPHLDVPLWSLFFVWLLTSLCAFLYLASKTAFNAVVGSSVILQQLSFCIPTVLLMARKRSTTFLPPARSFRMPNMLGWMVNSFSVSFITLMAVILCLPVAMSPDASSMNYTSVILAFSFLFGLANWLLHAKNHYGGPVIETWEGHDPGTTTAISVSSQNDDLCKNMVQN
ncbi:hypothetical protein AARAC_007327 [Aspergillus arachidicola]|uniref:Choline transport protein n=1 Tax=Aspergillus arachidicola TaxID=656916 RepID=A0A2G7FYC9_9EURO|nr:hypothetical protein AARAC_007327 [Aspergillus arachidicola]